MSHSDTRVPIDNTSLQKPNFGHHLMDFANMLKAFIGSNYLAIAFAFRQSGLALGMVGLLLIASLTAHCCQLLVSCKYHTIRQLLSSVHRSKSNNMALKLQPELSSNNDDSLSSVSSDNDDGSDGCGNAEDEAHYDVMHRQLLRNLNFGDIGRLCLGRAGLMLVNSAVMVTQFGFCVGYFIFVGNTIHSMFPLYNCSVSAVGSDVPDIMHQCFEVKHINSLNSVHVDMNDMVEASPGVMRTKRSVPLLDSEGNLLGQLNNTSVWTTTTTTPATETTESFVTFLASSKISVLHASTGAASDTNVSTVSNISDITNPTDKTNASDERNAVSNSTISTGISAVTSSITGVDKKPEVSSIPTVGEIASVTPNIVSDENVTTFPLSGSSNSQVNVTVTESTQAVNTTRWALFRAKHVPNLRLLVISPMIVFVPMTLIRNLRHLGFISVLANASIFIGCIEVFFFLIGGFVVNNTFVWANWRDVPIFFGMVTSAFEGIGTILHIESSMEGNRHNFLSFLYGAVAVLTLVLGCFGVLGYVSFGDGIEQMINANIPTSHWLGLIVNGCLCVGVVLTFPLMIYPVVDMAEVHVFGDGCICGPESTRAKKKVYHSLLPKKGKGIALPVAKKVSDSVATWKRNVLRTFIVLCAGSLAIVLRNYFAYISAFVGALGSTMLAYILPCVFHLKLCWQQLSLFSRIKDVTIIVLGVCFGAAGVYSVLLEIFSSLKA